MHLPTVFLEEDPDLTLKIMRENVLANVITQGHEPMVNPVPTLVDASNGVVTVRFHLALHNPQCQMLGAGTPCLLVFTGPNCYVSPSWYTEQPNVPTWNYVCVHAYGTSEVLDHRELEQVLIDLTAAHEPASGRNWRYEELPLAFRQELLAEIRGFRLRVSRLEAKTKLSQNRLAVDRERITRALLESSSASARAVGKWMIEKFGKSRAAERRPRD